MFKIKLNLWFLNKFCFSKVRFSSQSLSQTLLELKNAPNDQKLSIATEILPILVEKRSNLSELLKFYRSCNETTEADFQPYFTLFSHFFQKYSQTFNLKSFEKADILALIELLFRHPSLITKNRGFFHSLDLHFTKNPENNVETLMKVLYLAVTLNTGSEQLITIFEKTKEFSDVSPETLVKITTSLHNCDFLSAEFAKNIYLALQEKKTLIKPSLWLDILYSASILNLPDNKQIYESGLKGENSLQTTVFSKNSDIMRYLWALMYFSLKFNEKIEDKMWEGLIGRLRNGVLMKSPTAYRSFSYKIHEIELFLNSFHPQLYASLWKYENKMKETEWFKGGMDKLSSILQKDVEIILKISNIPYEKEKRIHKIYIVDFFIPDKNTVLEINGPHHYSLKKKNGDALINGVGFVKSSLLRKLGFRTINLSYKKWYSLQGVTTKMEFMRHLIYA